MCLILKQAITPLCAPRTLPLCILRHWLYPCSPLCTEASDYTLIHPYVCVPKLKWLCPETRRRYSKEAHEQNTDNDV